MGKSHPIPERYRSEISQEFHDGMNSRMFMSFEKYGPVADAYPHKIDALRSAFVRLLRYMGPTEFGAAVARAVAAPESVTTESGNTENLMDAANFLMIEFMHPRHANAHFRAEDSSASPGRVATDGQLDQRSNSIEQDNVRLGGTRMKTSGGFYDREGD